MIVTYALGVDENIGSELSQEPAPRRVEEPCVRTELSKLSHHGRLAKERRIQPADHFEQEAICFPAVIDLDTSREQLVVLSGFDQRTIFDSIQKENSAETGLPLEAIEHGRHLSPGLVSQIQDDQLVYHASILEKAAFLLSSVCH